MTEANPMQPQRPSPWDVLLLRCHYYPVAVAVILFEMPTVVLDQTLVIGTELSQRLSLGRTRRQTWPVVQLLLLMVR